MDGNWIKIALDVNDEIHLTQLNVDLSVEEIVRGICEDHGIRHEVGVFSLKVQDFCNIVGTEYVTEENKGELKHGRQLKLSKSPRERVKAMVERLLDSEDSVECLQDLATASKDSVVLREMNAQGVVSVLREFAAGRILSEEEDYRAFKIIGQFLARNYLERLTREEVTHLVEVITCDMKTTREMLILAFDLLILLRKKGSLHWPVKLLRKLTPYVRLYEEVKLQERVLHFINYLYTFANDPEERNAVLDFMMSSIMITYINKYVIRENLSDSMKSQLYLYQRIILRKYKKQAETMDVKEEKVLDNLEYVVANIGLVNQVRCMRVPLEAKQRRSEGGRDGEKAIQILRSLRTSLTPAGRQRAGSAPEEGIPSPGADFENEFLTRKIEQRRQLSRRASAESAEGGDSDPEEFPSDRRGIQEDGEAARCPSFAAALARDNIFYFIIHDFKGFEHLMLLHSNQLKSVYRVSVGVTVLLCRIFEIRDAEPEIRRGRFVPLCFLYYHCILERLFCIALKLFHRTREGMGVAVDSSEYPAVFHMVEEQISGALDSEPIEFSELEERVKELSVEEILRRRERRVKEEVKRQLTLEPAFVELRELLTPRILLQIREKRMSFMEKGEHLPVFDYKGQRVSGKRWFLSISKGRERLKVEECPEAECGGGHRHLETVLISDIREVESGKKSNFYKEVYYNLYSERDMFFRQGVRTQEPELKFPISLKLHGLHYVDFSGASETSMDSWVDGLRLLTGEKMNSKTTERELEYLLDVELMTHLAELEGISVPAKPPPLPPPPPDYNFATE